MFTLRPKRNSKTKVGRAAGLAVAGILALATALAGCSSQPADKPKTTAPTKSVSINFAPIAGQAPIVLAQNEGYFKDQGLEVKNVKVPGAPVAIANLLSGKQQFVAGNIGSIAVAMSKGSPLKVIAPCFSMEDDQGIYVRADSAIKSVSDFAGKTISLGTLGNNFQAAVMANLEDAGVDPQSVKYSLIPLTDGVRVLKAGQAEAAQAIEPFITEEGDSIRPIIQNVWKTSIGVSSAPMAVIATTEEYAKNNPDVIARFLKGYDKGLDAAVNNHPLLLSTIESLTGLSASVIGKIKLPPFETTFNADAAVKELKLMQKYGMLDPNFDVSRINP